jgi:3-keto-L-gulonate-6-phosphate decarboxylase
MEEVVDREVVLHIEVDRDLREAEHRVKAVRAVQVTLPKLLRWAVAGGAGAQRVEMRLTSV